MKCKDSTFEVRSRKNTLIIAIKHKNAWITHKGAVGEERVDFQRLPAFGRTAHPEWPKYLVFSGITLFNGVMNKMIPPRYFEF